MKRSLIALCLVSLAALPAFARKSPNGDGAMHVMLTTTEGQYAGSATLTQHAGSGSVDIMLDVENLSVGEHAIQIVPSNSCDASTLHAAAMSSGQALPQRINVGNNNHAKMNITTKSISLNPNAPNSILAHGGSALIIDQAGKSTGAACGVILPASVPASDKDADGPANRTATL